MSRFGTEKRSGIHPGSHVAHNAIIDGDVEIGENSFVGFGAVIVAESGPVRIGANVVVMEQAVLRGVRDAVLEIGDNVLIGPHTSLNGCVVESGAFIATGATIFNGARIGARSEVRINGIVQVDTLLPPDTTVPIGWIAVGNPVRLLPPDRHDDIWAIQKGLNFPGRVFGQPRPAAGETFMNDLMPRYAAKLIRRHAGAAGDER